MGKTLTAINVTEAKRKRARCCSLCWWSSLWFDLETGEDYDIIILYFITLFHSPGLNKLLRIFSLYAYKYSMWYSVIKSRSPYMLYKLPRSVFHSLSRISGFPIGYEAGGALNLEPTCWRMFIGGGFEIDVSAAPLWSDLNKFPTKI
jgi:hypothetical protein